MTATMERPNPDKCKCDHRQAQHTMTGKCLVPGCGCIRYRPVEEAWERLREVLGEDTSA
jgi:hypothetical protein